MESINPTWGSWIVIAIWLGALWLVVRMLERSFPGFVRALPFPPRVILAIRLMRRWLPFVILLVLIWRFVIISPMTHGILLFALIIGGFQGIQSFFLGWPIRSRLVLYANPWLRCGPYSGRVDRFGLLAVEIINPQGRHNLSYLTLSRKGYSLLPEGGEETFLECTLAPDLNVTGEEPKRALQDLLALCPYTDWNHPPSIRLLSDQNDHLVLNVNLLTSRFEGPFRNLLQEAGFRSVRNQPATHHPFTSHDIVD
ncbi:MAG: hypothetical protein R2787_13395 [Saprospiraceae bacterium]